MDQEDLKQLLADGVDNDSDLVVLCGIVRLIEDKPKEAAVLLMQVLHERGLYVKAREQTLEALRIASPNLTRRNGVAFLFLHSLSEDDRMSLILKDAGYISVPTFLAFGRVRMRLVCFGLSAELLWSAWRAVDNRDGLMEDLFEKSEEARSEWAARVPDCALFFAERRFLLGNEQWVRVVQAFALQLNCMKLVTFLREQNVYRAHFNTELAMRRVRSAAIVRMLLKEGIQTRDGISLLSSALSPSIADEFLAAGVSIKQLGESVFLPNVAVLRHLYRVRKNEMHEALPLAKVLAVLSRGFESVWCHEYLEVMEEVFGMDAIRAAAVWVEAKSGWWSFGVVSAMLTRRWICRSDVSLFGPLRCFWRPHTHFLADDSVKQCVIAALLALRRTCRVPRDIRYMLLVYSFGHLMNN